MEVKWLVYTCSEVEIPTMRPCADPERGIGFPTPWKFGPHSGKG